MLAPKRALSLAACPGEWALLRLRTKLVLSSTLAYERFLVAEDDPLISMDLQDVLEDEGAMVLPASSVTQALRLAQTPALSAAVIDIKLGTENAEPVCEALSQRQVPFIFYTACPDWSLNRWCAAPFVTKPALDSVIIGALKYVVTANKHDTLSPLAEDGGNPTLIAIEQSIVDGEERVARIAHAIARLKAGGFDTSAAEALYETMTALLNLIRDQRRLLASAKWRTPTRVHRRP
jgi:DNA-binding response OmpR family regulator